MLESVRMCFFHSCQSICVLYLLCADLRETGVLQSFLVFVNNQISPRLKLFEKKLIFFFLSFPLPSPSLPSPFFSFISFPFLSLLKESQPESLSLGRKGKEKKKRNNVIHLNHSTLEEICMFDSIKGFNRSKSLPFKSLTFKIDI